jgi:hypothetical protein
MRSMLRGVAVLLAGIVLAAPTDAKALTVFADSGATAASITGTVDAYRAALGDPNNGNAPGPLATGRREINWDGGGPPTVDGTPPVTPFNVFTNTRGAMFTTPGTGLTQAPSGAVPPGGANALSGINPTYADLFLFFSPNRLFAPVGSNVTEGVFSIPGTVGTVPAGVSGFGAVFSDVDLQGPTTIEYFDILGNLIGEFTVPAPATTGNQTFSFLGIVLDPGDGFGFINRILITTGTNALGPNESPTVDLVVMDDFFYGEPQQLVQVPQPGSLSLLGLGLVALGAYVRVARIRGSI